MSEASPPIDRDAEMLGRLAELDLAAAEHVHAKLIAATETAEIADLGRTYQRMSRSLRQTLALKAKLVRERKVAASYAAIERTMINPAIEGFTVDDRVMELQDAVERVVEAAFPGDDDRSATLLGRFDYELDDWTCEENFADADLDAQVRRACRMLDLPESLAARWRTLPRPVFTPDPATNDPPGDQPAAAPPRPWTSSA